MPRPRTVLALVMIAAGCSRQSEPVTEPRHDSAQAHAALVAALDAWKNEQTQSLAQRKPPIRFVDDDLAAGLRLVDYEIEEPDAPIRLHENVAVILSLRDARGKVIRRETHYQIATDPGLAVLRGGR